MAVTYAVKVDPEDHEWLTHLSTLTGRPKAFIVREALDRYRRDMVPLDIKQAAQRAARQAVRAINR